MKLELECSLWLLWKRGMRWVSVEGVNIAWSHTLSFGPGGIGIIFASQQKMRSLSPRSNPCVMCRLRTVSSSFTPLVLRAIFFFFFLPKYKLYFNLLWIKPETKFMDMRFSLTLFLFPCTWSPVWVGLYFCWLQQQLPGVFHSLLEKSQRLFWKAKMGMVGCSSALSLHGKALASRVPQGWPLWAVPRSCPCQRKPAQLLQKGPHMG